MGQKYFGKSFAKNITQNTITYCINTGNKYIGLVMQSEILLFSHNCYFSLNVSECLSICQYSMIVRYNIAVRMLFRFLNAV